MNPAFSVLMVTLGWLMAGVGAGHGAVSWGEVRLHPVSGGALVLIQTLETGDWVPGKPGQFLPSRALIRTPPGSAAWLDLPRLGGLWLEPETRIRLKTTASPHSGEGSGLLALALEAGEVMGILRGSGAQGVALQISGGRARIRQGEFRLSSTGRLEVLTGEAIWEAGESLRATVPGGRVLEAGSESEESRATLSWEPPMPLSPGRQRALAKRLTALAGRISATPVLPGRKAPDWQSVPTSGKGARRMNVGNPRVETIGQ